MKPFGMDLDVTSNRSSTISQVNLHMLQDFSAWENARYKKLDVLNTHIAWQLQHPGKHNYICSLLATLQYHVFLYCCSYKIKRVQSYRGRQSNLLDLRVCVTLMGCIFPAIIIAFSWLSFNCICMVGVNIHFV